MGNLAIKKDMADFVRKTGGIGRSRLKLRTSQFDFKRSGRLSRSIDLTTDLKGKVLTATVSVGPVTDLKPGEDPDYPWYVYRGTGLFGPYKTKILPKNKKAMAFKGEVKPFGKIDEKTGEFVGNVYLLKSTQGQEPQDYISSSIEAMQKYIDTYWRDLANDIKKEILVSGLSESTARMSF